MNRIPSRTWTSAIVATTILACLVSALVFVADVEAQQQEQASEAEIEARVRAELEARMAQINQRLLEQMQQVETLRAGDVERLQRQMQELAMREERLAETLQRQYAMAAEMQARAVEEGAERGIEAERRAREVLEQTLRRREMMVSSRGGCDAIGELALNWADELELTDDQVGSIRDAQRAVRRERIGRDADMEVGEMDLEALYEADDLDLGAIRTKLEELAMLGVENQMAGLALRNQVLDTLTPDQRAQFDDRRNTDNVRVVISGVGSGWSVDRIGC